MTWSIVRTCSSCTDFGRESMRKQSNKFKKGRNYISLVKI